MLSLQNQKKIANDPEIIDFMLTDEILIEICSYLSPKDIAQLQKTGKKFNAFFQANNSAVQLIWKRLLARDFPQFYEYCVNDIFVKNANKLKDIDLKNMVGISEVYQAYVSNGNKFDFRVMYIEYYERTFPYIGFKSTNGKNSLHIQTYYACTTNNNRNFLALLKTVESPEKLGQMFFYGSDELKCATTLTLFKKVEPWLPEIYQTAVDVFSINPNKVCQESGWGLVHWAAVCGMSSKFATLENQGHDINLQSNTGLTPLILAAWRNDLTSVEKLLELGAVAVDPAGKTQTTALGNAVSHLNVQMVAVLMQNEAEIYHENDCIWDNIHTVSQIFYQDGSPLNDKDFKALAEILPPPSIDKRIFPILKLYLEDYKVRNQIISFLNLAVYKIYWSFAPEKMLPLIHWLMELMPKDLTEDELSNDEKLMVPKGFPDFLKLLVRWGGCLFGIADTFDEALQEWHECPDEVKKVKRFIVFYLAIKGENYFPEQLNKLLELWKESFVSENDKIFLESFASECGEIKANYSLAIKQGNLIDFYKKLDESLFKMVSSYNDISQTLLEQITFLVTELIAPNNLARDLLSIYSAREAELSADPDSLTPHKMNVINIMVYSIQSELKNILIDMKADETFKKTYFSDTTDPSNDAVARFR